jgi:hypothetical protein
MDDEMSRWLPDSPLLPPHFLFINLSETGFLSHRLVRVYLCDIIYRCGGFALLLPQPESETLGLEPGS